jgi:predicted pyridoxine 5'-phosphate oxidase superfamily flavin-nucleotide-binding protein
VGSALGVPDEKMLALADWEASPLFNETERLALEYADRMTITGRDVDDAVFARLQSVFDDDAIVELTATIAWENASSTFNRALRVESQGLWKPADARSGQDALHVVGDTAGDPAALPPLPGDRGEEAVGILTDEMQRVVREQKLGYVATVCPDGTPNLSPKGTTAVWDENRLVFADIASPRSVANLRANPAVEINVIDPIARKGWRFKGRGVVYDGGAMFDEVVAWYRRNGTASPIRSVALVDVERALPLISPAYERGATEAEVRRR